MQLCKKNSTFVRLYDEMMKDAQMVQYKEDNDSLFCALYLMRLWKSVLKGRQPICV